MNETQSRRRFLGILSAGAAATVAPAALAATLAPLAATAPSVLPAAVAGPSADATLLTLIDNYWTAKAEADRAYEVFAPFEEKRFARRRRLLQNPPEALRVRPEDHDLLPKSNGRLLYDGDGFHGIRVDRQDGTRHLDLSVANLAGDRWLIGERLSDLNDPLLSLATRWVTPTPAARVRADEILVTCERLRRSYERKPAGYRAAERAMEAANHRVNSALTRIRNTRAQSFAGLVAKAKLARDDAMDEPMALSLVSDLCALGEAVPT